jgi:hypothetical protein
MLSRAWLLLESSLPRESRRTDATVIRVIYAILSLAVLFAVVQSPVYPQGKPLLIGLTVIHAAMAILLGVRLAGDVAGDRSSGVVGLLALAGLKGNDVVAARLISVVLAFLSVWIVRIPMLVLTFTLGGIHLQQMLMVELLLLGLFILVVGVGLLHAHYAPDRAMARIVFLLPGLLEFGLHAPKVIIAILRTFQLIRVPTSFVEFAGMLRAGSFSSSVYAVIRFPDPSGWYLIPAALHIALGTLSLYCWRRVYFTCLDEAGDAAAPTSESRSKLKSTPSKSRPSRPCWDDALAWQAYQIHSEGRWNMIGRGTVVGVVLIGAAVMASLGVTPFPQLALVLLAITSAILLFMGQGKVSDCLQRELKDKTLPSLLMTPHTPIELCDGWGRGATWMMLVDLPVHLAALGGFLFHSMLPAAPIIFGAYVLMLSMRSFLILSPLVPFSFRGIVTGVGLIAVVIVLLIIALPLSVNFHPWLGPLVLGPLAYGWSRVCRSMIPAWFEKKQEALE